jgi:hypothetical protein
VETDLAAARGSASRKLSQLPGDLPSEPHGDSTEITQARLKDYDEVLYEWNDQLNLNLALVGAYFGQAGRDWLHNQIYERCQAVGAELESMYRNVVQQGPLTTDVTELELHLSALNDSVYRLGVFMMTQLRNGKVGKDAPRSIIAPESPELATGPAITLPGIASYKRSGHSWEAK